MRLEVYDDHIFFSCKNVKLEIPLSDIDFANVTVKIGSRGTQQEAMAYAGAGMSLGSLGAMAKDLFVKFDMSHIFSHAIFFKEAFQDKLAELDCALCSALLCQK